MSFSTGGLVVQVRDLLERAVDVGLVQPSATVVLRMVTPTGGATAMDLRVVPKVRLCLVLSLAGLGAQVSYSQQEVTVLSCDMWLKSLDPKVALEILLEAAPWAVPALRGLWSLRSIRCSHPCQAEGWRDHPLLHHGRGLLLMPCLCWRTFDRCNGASSTDWKMTTPLPIPSRAMRRQSLWQAVQLPTIG